MSKKNSLIRDIITILLIGVGIFLVIYLQKGNFKKMKPGAPAPDFELYSLTGNKVKLSNYRGKVVLLNFWATWCSPCREEIPSLNRLYELLGNKGLVILAVSEDNRGVTVVKPFAERFGITFPVLLDTSRRVGNLYSIGGVPETFLIDKNGIIRYKFVGPKNWTSPSVVSFIKKYLEDVKE